MDAEDLGNLEGLLKMSKKENNSTFLFLFETIVRIGRINFPE